MLRIHFTAEDLARTRLLATWGPLAETLFSLMTLNGFGAEALFGGWRERIRRESGVTAHPASALFEGAVLDLFTVTGPAASMTEGLEALMGARPDHVRTELAQAARTRVDRGGCTGAWAGATVREFAHDRAGRGEFARFLHDHHESAVAPHWSQVHTRLQAEQAGHARTLATHGVEAMLAGLPPGFRWRPPFLEVGRGPSVWDVNLAGRGLTLVPSVFCQTQPIAYRDSTDEQAPAVLFFPVLRTAADAARLWSGPEAASPHKALATLLGRTRASALDAIGGGPCTTGQLAQRVAASLPTASEHATVLRKAGLITTTRHGSAVLHALTPLGAALLDGRHDTGSTTGP